MASLANAVLLLGLPAGLPAPLGLFFNCLLTILPQVIDLVRVNSNTKTKFMPYPLQTY
jgi:hypothetical protein